MSFVSLNEILGKAKKEGYGIGCFNAIDLNMVRGIIEAAEMEKSPVIICHAEVHFKITPIEILAPVLTDMARRARVPVALLLDHGRNFDSIVRSMKLGMNAVMFDGTQFAYEENVEKTAEFVKIARAMNCSVEGELGRVARPVSAGAEGYDDDSIIHDQSLYTDPAQAADFVSRTGVDALAIAFGTVHGVYLEEPRLDLVRLKEISDATGVPLVMHGGSGLMEKDYTNSIHNGITKINYYTNLALKTAQIIEDRMKNRGEKSSFYHDVMCWAIEAVRDDVSERMRLFGSSGKA